MKSRLLASSLVLALGTVLAHGRHAARSRDEEGRAALHLRLRAHLQPPRPRRLQAHGHHPLRPHPQVVPRPAPDQGPRHGLPVPGPAAADPRPARPRRGSSWRSAPPTRPSGPRSRPATFPSPSSTPTSPTATSISTLSTGTTCRRSAPTRSRRSTPTVFEAKPGPNDHSPFAAVRFWVSKQYWAFLRIDGPQRQGPDREARRGAGRHDRRRPSTPSSRK